MTQVYVSGKALRLDPSKSIGKGGEAEVWDIGNGLALKVYYNPQSPVFAGDPKAKHDAKQKLAQQQKKLPQFPTTLPETVIQPLDLAFDANQRIVGYTMKYLSNTEVLRSYGQKSFRDLGVDNEAVVKIFRDLYKTVRLVHEQHVVIGDFNDLNVLVSGTQAYLIDADSFQYGSFPCTVFTARFVDPLKCDSHANHMELIRPHDEYSDWYAFTVMLMQSLLFVDPYGGVYRPVDKTKRVDHNARPLHRITIFHPDVRYPGKAIPYSVLPDSLLDLFHRTFEKDKRGEFPISLLETMRWTTCSSCGAVHARSRCPVCTLASPASVREVKRGKATFTRIFRTSGKILYVTTQGGTLRWLYHENGVFKRENTTVGPGSPDPTMRFRIRGDVTIIAQRGRMVTLKPGSQPEQLSVDSVGSLPSLDANISSRYWIANGYLMRDGIVGSEVIGQVLSHQTLFWVGQTFGFGFYRAGELSVAFVFDAKLKGINDTVKLPPIRGKLVDATAAFSSRLCWFFTATQESGKTIHTCHVINSQGGVEATATGEENDGTWLGTIRGKYATGDVSFTATDEGIVRVKVANGGIEDITVFQDTEPFTNTGQALFAESHGDIYVVSGSEIHLLHLD